MTAEISDRTDFTLTTVRHDDVVIVTPSGEIDIATAPTLASALRQAADGSERTVVLDLRDTPFIDAVGVGLLVRVNTMCRITGHQLIVRRPHTNVMRVLDLTGTADLLAIEPDA